MNLLFISVNARYEVNNRNIVHVLSSTFATKLTCYTFIHLLLTTNTNWDPISLRKESNDPRV